MTDQQQSELVVLRKTIASFYQEQLANHVHETRQSFIGVLSHTEISQYLSKVDNAGISDRPNGDYMTCSNLLNSSFRQSLIDAVRFHERYDALRGLKRGLLALDTVRRLESPNAIDYLDDDANFGEPFEAKVMNREMVKSYPHWSQDMDGHLPVAWLYENWAEPDPPAFVPELAPKRSFFKAMGRFYGGLIAFKNRDLQLVKKYQQSADARLHMAERPVERELLLMTGGYLKQAVDLIEARLHFWTGEVRNRSARIAFASHGISLATISPASRKLYIELSNDLCRSLASDPALARTANVIADLAEQIQASSAPVAPSIAETTMGLSLPPLGRP